MKKPCFIGISGGSASGKTTLLRSLVEHFDPSRLTLISQDNYYRKRDDLPRDEKGEINFDDPGAVDLMALEKDIRKLSAGESIEIEEYTFNNPSKNPGKIVSHPAPIIVVEGLFIFTEPRISDLLDLKVFVDADEHVKLSRRIRRDYEERGYTLEQVLDYYEKFVVPMYRLHVEPYKYDCDIIIPNNSHMQRAVQVLISYLESRL